MLTTTPALNQRRVASDCQSAAGFRQRQMAAAVPQQSPAAFRKREAEPELISRTAFSRCKYKKF